MSTSIKFRDLLPSARYFVFSFACDLISLTGHRSCRSRSWELPHLPPSGNRSDIDSRSRSACWRECFSSMPWTRRNFSTSRGTSHSRVTACNASRSGSPLGNRSTASARWRSLERLKSSFGITLSFACASATNHSPLFRIIAFAGTLTSLATRAQTVIGNQGSRHRAVVSSI